MENKKEKNGGLQLIPKIESYIQYMLEVILKIPRTEKFNIGNDYKLLMYETLENILYIEKIDKYKRIYYLNIIDTKLNVQRILLRIMYKNKWIDERKFNVAIGQIYEIGKILGGLIKYYGKMDKK